MNGGKSMSGYEYPLLYGNMLESAPLKFDYTSPSCISTNVYAGLCNYGAYDKNIFTPKKPKIAIIYPARVGQFIPIFEERFEKGYEKYPGLKKWFLINEVFFGEYPIQYTNRPQDYEKDIEEVIQNNYDFAFVIIEKDALSKKIYSLIKAELLANGIPSQFIRSDRLKLDKDFQWILCNLAVSFYAKIGGTPWVIGAEENASLAPEIVIGVSRAKDKEGKFIIGYTTIYKENGDFLLSKFQGPISRKEEYEEYLQTLIRDSIEAYRKKEGEPKTIVCHFHKRTGKKEVNAVIRGINDASSDAKFALLHLNSFSNYRIFDTSHVNYIPYDGLVVRLSFRQALLLTIGRDKKTNKSRSFSPRPIEVTMDKNSTVDFEYFDELLQQVYNFSRINWRGINDE